MLVYVLENFLGGLPSTVAWFGVSWFFLRRYRSWLPRLGGWLIGSLPLVAYLGMWLSPEPPTGHESAWMAINGLFGFCLGVFAAIRANRKGPINLKLI